MDSRFQEELLEKAKQAGKIPNDYQIPVKFRNNTPQRLKIVFKTYKNKGLFPDFPFGTDFNDMEIVLGKVLNSIEAGMATPSGIVKSVFKAMDSGPVPETAKPYLVRLQLDKPATL